MADEGDALIKAGKHYADTDVQMEGLKLIRAMSVNGLTQSISCQGWYFLYNST